MKNREIWPALPFPEWKDTAATLQLWTQIVGKVRLTLTPWINHSWHVTLYLTARGLTTSPIPCGRDIFEMGAVTRFSGRRLIQEAFRTCQTQSRGRPTQTRSVVAVSGPEARPCRSRSFTPMHYPAPEGFAEARVGPAGAGWNRDSARVCSAVRESEDGGAPNELLMEFLQSSYEAAATLAKWDRPALEHEGSWPQANRRVTLLP